MGIDPMLYEKYSGRKGDPNSRLGDALAKSDSRQAKRDTMPKGVAGGLRVTMQPGSWSNIFYFWKWFSYSKNKD